jgi:cysteine desulfurase
MVAAWEEREKALARGDATVRIQWRDTFVRRLREISPEVEVLGASAQRLWNTVAALMPDQPDCRKRWVVLLDKAGFAVSTGSACASGKEKPSHVLLAMGCNPERAGNMLRFSSGWETPPEDWEALAGALERLVTPRTVAS